MFLHSRNVTCAQVAKTLILGLRLMIDDGAQEGVVLHDGIVDLGPEKIDSSLHRCTRCENGEEGAVHKARQFWLIREFREMRRAESGDIEPSARALSGGIHASHPRQRAQRREASRELTEIRELPELSESAARDEKISSAVSSSMSFVVGSLDDLLSIRVDHLPKSIVSAVNSPLVEREESQIASAAR